MQSFNRSAVLLVLIHGIVAGARGNGTLSPPQDVGVEREWKAELFRPSSQDLLGGFTAGDTLVWSGRVESGHPMRLVSFGHEGTISAPLTPGQVADGNLLRGRFRVVKRAGQARLRLLAALDRLDTRTVTQQATHDYGSLLSRIKRLCSGPGSSLIPERATMADFRIVTPPEGWRVLYLTLERTTPKYELHIAFRYEQARNLYHVTRCWAEERPRTGVAARLPAA